MTFVAEHSLIPAANGYFQFESPLFINVLKVERVWESIKKCVQSWNRIRKCWNRIRKCSCQIWESMRTREKLGLRKYEEVCYKV